MKLVMRVKCLILYLLVSFTVAQETPAKPSIKPVQILSVAIDGKLLSSNIVKNKMQIVQKLNSSPDMLKDCKVLGSISQINLLNNNNTQFFFRYKLNPDNSTLTISIFFKSPINEPPTANLLITLDFMIGIVPTEMSIMQLNMSSYQQHVFHHNTKQYDLLFFLNGWNNISLSGNVTHGYQDGADMYTVHYMTCDGEMLNMGWRQQIDYLLFTLIVVPNQQMVQKFKLNDKLYSLDFKPHMKYFYGIKGTLSNQFVGNFYQRMGGIAFKAQNFQKNLTYGLSMLAYQSRDELKDQRTNQSYTAIYLTILVCIAVALAALSCFIRFKILKENNQLNEQIGSMEHSQMRKDDRQSDFSKHKYDIHTVHQVDEKYESSLKGSHNPKVEDEPDIKLQQ